ncbi:Uncharacterized protein PBTT_02331 [Plasmodiophora brassicae]|uniref:Uncharacterized protein n=1 Tax=Plasmodiophora brassicae TaxID=37360 RepID=A0A0G4J6I5_PLABS|nr:hypothetical protein PBRA_002873 [Plasmodiophora brassicae]SPQ95011.1 unnamed protein product [Plasmodiophora brassicae]
MASDPPAPPLRQPPRPLVRAFPNPTPPQGGLVRRLPTWSSKRVSPHGAGQPPSPDQPPSYAPNVTTYSPVGDDGTTSFRKIVPTDEEEAVNPIMASDAFHTDLPPPPPYTNCPKIYVSGNVTRRLPAIRNKTPRLAPDPAKTLRHSSSSAAADTSRTMHPAPPRGPPPPPPQRAPPPMPTTAHPGYDRGPAPPPPHRPPRGYTASAPVLDMDRVNWTKNRLVRAVQDARAQGQFDTANALSANVQQLDQLMAQLSRSQNPNEQAQILFALNAFLDRL